MKSVYTVFMLWLFCLVMAFNIPNVIAPTGEGFTRGANRLPLILTLHGLAFGLAIYQVRRTMSEWSQFKLLNGVLGFLPITTQFILVLLLLSRVI